MHLRSPMWPFFVWIAAEMIDGGLIGILILSVVLTIPFLPFFIYFTNNTYAPIQSCNRPF